MNESTVAPPGRDPEWVALMLDSHARLLGRPLAPPGEPDPAGWLYQRAPFGLLAHDAAADPRFVYVNRSAQRAFEGDWARLVGMPSRLSAEPDRQPDRDRFVAAVREHGYASGYRGLRIACSGRRFWIEDVTMWNLVDRSGRYHGQAAAYGRITPAPAAEA